MTALQRLQELIVSQAKGSQPWWDEVFELRPLALAEIEANRPRLIAESPESLAVIEGLGRSLDEIYRGGAPALAALERSQ